MKENLKELVLNSTTWFGAVGCFDCAAVKEPQAGFYLFYDGSHNKWPSFGREKGIFIDNLHYIPLQPLNPSLMDKKQVLEYCEKEGVKIPYLCELVPLLHHGSDFDAIDMINDAFCGYNRKDCFVPKDVIGGYWYQEAIENASETELRRLLLVENMSDVPASNSMVFFNEENSKIEAFVTPKAEVWLKKDQAFEQQNFFLWVDSFEMKFLTIGTTFLFQLEAKVLKLVGYRPERIGKDVICCSEGVFQIDEEGMHQMLTESAYAKFDEKDQLVLNVHNDFYGGGEQWVKENYFYYFQRNEKGRWVNVGNTYN